jgi:UDP-N-acetylmuramyl pentapeptide phosphotransferase/UDP-N-acetylglucosamine-1-phosphate transferase
MPIVTGDRMVWAGAWGGGREIEAVMACGVIVAVTEPLTIALLRRHAVLDLPGRRSSHTVATPRGGGAPIVLGLVAAALIAPAPGLARLATVAA